MDKTEGRNDGEKRKREDTVKGGWNRANMKYKN